MHMVAPAIWMPIGTEGMTQTMMYGDGYGLSRSDLYSTSLMDFHRGWRGQADSLSETTKMMLMFGTYINNNFGPRYYGKALNISRRLTAAYDKALETYDLLLMPTTPMKATPLPAPGASREEQIGRAFEMITNTAPFDITHHPAMSLPCGMVDGLPDRADADRPAFRRADDLSCRARLRTVRRLEEDVGRRKAAGVAGDAAWIICSPHCSRS